MRPTKLVVMAALLLVASTGATWAQSTFGKVYSILQNNCASCHGGATPVAFDLGTTPAQTYAALVGVTPANPAAAAKGHKLVDPGHPYNSFLLKKVGQSLDGYFTPAFPAEGNNMPGGGAPALSAFDAEMIRQWILTGARQSGTQVDTALIKDYYTNGGQAFQTPPAAPAPGTGFQVRMGPIFLPTAGTSGSEIEFLKKEELHLGADMEVNRVDVDMNSQSHHFLLFMWDDSTAAAAYAPGLRVVSLLNVATDGNKVLHGTWQYDYNMDLPAGTAFYYDNKDILDLNSHLKNYSTTQILPADLFVNIYTQPRGTGAREMRAQLVNNANLFLLPGNNSVSMEDTWGGDDREVWMIGSHTHKYGTDFDIFVKDSVTGNRGQQIYEGFYDPTYSFNQGFYSWEHPANRIFDPMITVHTSEGLIFDTDYSNTSGNFVTFGLTTNDEMQLSTYLYVNKHEVVAVGNAPATITDQYRFTVYPNPMQDVTTVDFGGVRRSGSYTLVDLTGKQLLSGNFAQRTAFTFERPALPAGVYMLQLQLDNGKLLSEKLVVR